ncbi:hypothetical protein F900_01832 [Acinetobacter modestus]|uniref:Uncharacterized protein n=1 Tax=Acinetobacter modestus TaxID=1776740 RepID=N9NHJ1_9GAMM|nr:hypothetical protein [Acinetobacter modestus]ENX01465.1 hypothetical protein F900_01832 [Acinetobacter modestus]
MTLYDWSTAPTWATCAARDFNGFAHWFENKAELFKEHKDDICGEWYATNGKSAPCDPFWHDQIDCPPYEQSFELRPEVNVQ